MPTLRICALLLAIGAVSAARADTPASAREAAVRDALAADRAAVIRLIGAERDTPLSSDPELRAIAERMPALQAELRELERQRDEASTRTPATSATSGASPAPPAGAE